MSDDSISSDALGDEAESPDRQGKENLAVDSRAGESSATQWNGAAKVAWTAAALTIGLVFTLALKQHAFGPPKTLNDFIQEWTSARNHFTGDPIYLPLRQSIRKHLHAELQTDVIKFNAHPPASVLLALPFAKHPYARALHLWNAVSLAALVVAVGLMMGRLGLGWSPWYLLPIFTILVSSNPLAQQMLQGQLNLILLLLLTGFWLAARNQSWFLSGILVGVAGAIKLFPLYLGLYFLGRRRWTAVLGVGIAFFAVNGLTWAILGGESYHAFFKDVAPAVAAEFQAYWPNASINGFFRKLFDGSVGHTVPLIHAPMLAVVLTAVGILGVTAITARQCWTANTLRRQDAAISLCVVAMLLVSPITWDHYFVILTPFLCVLWKQFEGSATRKAVLMVVILLLFSMRPTWIWGVVPGGRELALKPGDVPAVALTWHVLTAISFQFYCLATLWWLAKVSGDSLPSDSASANA